MAIMSLIHWTSLNGHAPYAHLKAVLKRLPTQNDGVSLFPGHWRDFFNGAKIFLKFAHLAKKILTENGRAAGLAGRVPSDYEQPSLSFRSP